MAEVVYEVSLVVNKELYSNFSQWLNKHVQDIVSLDGFICAEVVEPLGQIIDTNDSKSIRVIYRLESVEALHNYFDQHATRFRAEGLEKFPSGFSASRTTWQSVTKFKKKSLTRYQDMVFRTECIGIFCLGLVYLSVGYADYVVINWILLEYFLESVWFAVHLIIFNVLIVIMSFCHLRAVFTDPGIIPRPKVGIDFSDRSSREQLARPGWTICNKCDMYRPPRAHHCGTCKRCIRKMDHHCPWINNCVGECNQKFFMLFLFYTNMATVYAIILLMAGWVLESTRTQPTDTDRRESLVIHSVVLAVECILYFTFTVAIGCDQITAILSQKSQIDKLKDTRSRMAAGSRITQDAETATGDEDEQQESKRTGSSRRLQTTRELFEDVFGEEPLWKWFLPVPSSSINRRSVSDESGEFLL